MEDLWLLKGSHNAPGWGPLEKDAKEKKVDVLLFDRDRWALVRAATAPEGYEGFTVGTPPDGLFLDNQGRHVYVAHGAQVKTSGEVIAALGDEAKRLLEKIKDPDTVLERLGRAY